MSDEIPEQLAGYDLLKIYGPSDDCDHPGKQPVGSATDGPFFKSDDPELQRHIENGGNVGLPLTGSVVVFDVDHDQLAQLLDEQLPPTFTVRTGSGGEHRFYHSPDWTNDRQLNVDGTDYGSIRSDGWQVVIPPSVHPDTGERYQVEADRDITSVGSHEIKGVLETLEIGTASQHSGGGSGGSAAAGCAGGSSVPNLPEEYPNKPAEWKTLRLWLSSNNFLKELNRSSGDRSAREFTIAKCLAEGGFSEASISNVLDRLPHDSKWHERGSSYRNRTVRKAVVAAVEDPYVDFDTSPDDGKESGSDLSEGKRNRSEPMSSNNSTFVDKEKVVEHNGDGDAVQARIIQGTDGDTGEKFEYVDIATGSIEEIETVDGETVKAPQINDDPGQTTTLGSPEKLELKIEALKKLKESVK